MKTINKLYSIAKEFVKEYESNIKEIEINEPKQVGKKFEDTLFRSNFEESTEVTKQQFYQLSERKNENGIYTLTINGKMEEGDTVTTHLDKNGIPTKATLFKKPVVSCFDNCLKFFPENLHPKNQGSWLETIDKLNRLDKIPFSEIERITEAARKDEFISKNIFLSLPKLRTKNKDKIYWIVVWFERFKPKEQKINRQTQEVIEKNSKGW
jgi:hypothetical protein